MHTLIKSINWGINTTLINYKHSNEEEILKYLINIKIGTNATMITMQQTLHKNEEALN